MENKTDYGRGLVDIYFDDLSEQAQKWLLHAANIEKPEEANWDVFPLFTLNLSAQIYGEVY
jgi:hypothetical protein